MRAWIQALLMGVIFAAFSGCGGDEMVAGSALELGPASAGDATITSGSLQQRVLVLHNGASTTARNLRVNAALDAHVLQLPLSCAPGTTAVCQVSADGTLQIDQLPAGASLNLRQQLRIKAGYSGPVSNAWTVSSDDAAVAVQWQQAMQSTVADVGVTLQSVTVTGAGATRKLSYAISITNAGPDMAQNVAWTQTPSADMPLQGVRCSASGGAACPASLSGSITIAQMPKGGRVDLVVDYGGYSDPNYVGSEFLFSEVRTAGDPVSDNDRLMARQANASPLFDLNGVYDLIDYDGHAGRVSYSFLGTDHDLQFTIGTQSWAAGLGLDVTGFWLIRAAAAAPPHWYGGGTLQFTGRTLDHPQGLVTGSFDFGRGLQPFLVAHDWVTDLAELEGLSYTVLGSRTDATGQTLDAYAWTGRFSGGALLLCESDAPMPVGTCPAAQLHRYDAAVVGTQLELMSSTEVLHLRAVRSGPGPVLLRSERAADDSSATVWIGMPQVSAVSAFNPPNPFSGMPPASFYSSNGLALPTVFGLGFDNAGQLQLGGGGLSNGLWLGSQAYGTSGAPLCQISGSLLSTGVVGLSNGTIVGMPGLASSGAAPCYQGPVYLATTSEAAVMLGAKGGALSGRWLVLTQ